MGFAVAAHGTPAHGSYEVLVEFAACGPFSVF